MGSTLLVNEEEGFICELAMLLVSLEKVVLELIQDVDSLETIWLDDEDEVMISLVLDEELLIIVLDGIELSMVEDVVMMVLDWVWLLEGGKELLAMELSLALLIRELELDESTMSDEVTNEEELVRLLDGEGW